MSKELFDAVVGTPPPSTVDIRAIMRRRRRVVAARRIGASITSVVAIAALGVIGAAMRDSAGHEAHPSGTGTTVASVPAPSAESLRAALAAAVAARVPDAQWWPDGEPPVIAPPSPPSVSCDDCDPDGVRVSEAPSSGRHLLVGSALMARSGIIGRVSIALDADQAVLVCDESTGDLCATGSANGARMTTRWAETLGGAVTQREVAVELPGGRALVLAAEAPDANPGASPVLTEPELVDIARDIAATIGD